MTNQFDILIKNCQLRAQSEKRYDLGVSGGKIAALGESLTGEAQTVIDAQGNLVTEAFVNTHLHLCKVYTLPMMDELAMQDYHGADMGKAMTAIELAARIKEQYDESWIIKNVRKAVALSAIYGGTHIRAFADVDSKAKLIGAKALIQAREEFKGIVDIQVVAFAQDGIVREPGAADLMRQAMELGADVVGGIPWIEFTDADIAEHVKVSFDIAEEFDKPVSMLVDDAGDPGLRSLELMALETIKRGWHGRSLAHHARAMALYPKPYLQKVAALLKQAQMGVVSDPHTGPLHARVGELLEEGVLVCLGMDDISDAYYPYGRNNMLEVAFLVSHLLWMTTRGEMETLYDMVTTKPAQCIGLQDFKIKVGAPANIVVLGEPNVLEALRNHEAPAYVISHGKLVDQEKMKEIAKSQEWSA
ncbi:MAG: amidohydrolase family protein [Anaerolineales bacterium]|nr:amidohydrolase family protein [Anaerolineales bacterium]